ncbi:MAG: hypothetical protein E6Q59_04550 [Nitrosomonas sp.]|nr:MAG: hypothetical protein E6Q59_04550 [Nitrosomonas sp.]
MQTVYFRYIIISTPLKMLSRSFFQVKESTFETKRKQRKAKETDRNKMKLKATSRQVKET